MLFIEQKKGVSREDSLMDGDFLVLKNCIGAIDAESRRFLIQQSIWTVMYELKKIIRIYSFDIVEIGDLIKLLYISVFASLFQAQSYPLLKEKIRMFNRWTKRFGTKAQRKEAKQVKESDKVVEDTKTLKPIFFKKKRFFAFSKAKL